MTSAAGGLSDKSRQQSPVTCCPSDARTSQSQQQSCPSPDPPHSTVKHVFSGGGRGTLPTQHSITGQAAQPAPPGPCFVTARTTPPSWRMTVPDSEAGTAWTQNAHLSHLFHVCNK